ncbi:DUF1801 domain-containing protein [uncultured Sphingorhabdus sp.]|uniref:DUF1801 domain-containing protein n=1 Tax=uncultured Sphingorhabdus sp. TaxID=1686106 RepID=UPI00261F60F8|nr:DUF1801 domain-containing protein [uncultured Sphingorhabdus sp.]HMS21139.1 DUF1801 domain-containing protein [Sphingorhabdus sp.]
MSKNENKTKPSELCVDDFIAAVADADQRADAEKLRALMERLSGESAKMWGPSIIGFGSYHYKYESGREGDMCRIGFSPRKGQTVLYLIDGFEGQPELMARLGRHKTGKSCLYIKKMADIDQAALEELCARSLAYMADKYPPV